MVKEELKAKREARQKKEAKRKAYYDSLDDAGKKRYNRLKKNISCKKFKVCRMRPVYHTQLEKRTLKSKDDYKQQRTPNRITKLKRSLVPGTICILVAGKYKGSRVVFPQTTAEEWICSRLW